MSRNPGPSSDWGLDEEQFGLLSSFSTFRFNEVQRPSLPDFSTFRFNEVQRPVAPVVVPVSPVVVPVAPIVEEEEWQTVGPKVKKQATKPATKAKKQGSKPVTKPATSEKQDSKQDSKQSAAIHQAALLSAQEQLIGECIGQISRDTCQNVVTNMRHTLNFKKSIWLKFSDDDVVSQVEGTKHTFSRAHFFGNYAFQKELRERFKPLLPGAWIKIFPGGTKHTFCLAVTRARHEG
jgi:hypothetical protein